MATRILLVDDHRLVRKGVRGILESVPGLEVAAEGDNGREALRLAEALRPDLVLMDLSMPDMNGIETTRRLVSLLPGIRVVVLSMHSGDRFVREAAEAGANGYLLKDATAEEFVNAVRTVAGGGSWFSPRAGAQPDAGPGEPAGRQLLSNREREVLQLFSEGNGTKEVAYILGISAKTVEAHRTNLMRKLDLRSIAELTRYAIREGLTPL